MMEKNFCSDQANTLRRRAEEIAREKAARMPNNAEALSPDEVRQTLHELRVHQIELEMQNEELRRAQGELEESRARYFDLYDLAPVGYFNLSEAGLILEANLTAAALLGAARGSLVKQPISRFILKEDQDIYYRQRNLLFETGSPQACELRLVRTDTASLWVRIDANLAQEDETGAPVCRATMIDITERKREEEEKLKLEAQLLRARKLESLGVLAGGIAHDFNNLMAIVQGYIDLALIDLPPEHVSRQRLLNAMGSIEQTMELTDRLITFSQGGDPRREIFDVAEIIRDAVHRTVKGTEVRAIFDFKGNLWSAEIDEHQMTQVFCNLTTNAVEAMPQGGNLTVRAENVLMPAGEVLDLKEGSYLKVTFADEGIGINEECLSKIFDPYFTTKKMYTQKGLGLGLAVCYSVLKKHGGHITVKSHPGGGSSFVLYFPARVDLSK